MKNHKRITDMNVEYNTETGKIVGDITVEVTTSLDKVYKNEAVDARKKGLDRPTGGEVPYSYNFKVDNVVDEIMPLAVATAVIREQRQKSSFDDPQTFEDAFKDKIMYEELVKEGKSGVDVPTRVKRDATKLSKEDAKALYEQLQEQYAFDAESDDEDA